MTVVPYIPYEAEKVWLNDHSPFDGGWVDNWFGSTSAIEVAVADLDLDGDVDITTGSRGNEPYQVKTWENDGTPFSGSWTKYDIGATGTADAMSIVLADLDNDGDQDVVCGSGLPNNKIIAWENRANTRPTIGSITAPTTPFAINTQISTNASFTDIDTLDTHTAKWNWDDGTPPSTGTVTESSGSGSVTGTHTYPAPGIYTIGLTVADNKSGSATATCTYYVVAYDPNGGFVTGGDWINSPEKAYTDQPTLTGKATFGFVSKYQRGAKIPSGQTEFQFHVANLNFQSTGYDWLVIAGARVQYKGSGIINGAGNYGFILTAVDSQINGGGETDKFRIKIWDKSSGNIVYDNQTGASDDAIPTTSISGGSIVIHSSK